MEIGPMNFSGSILLMIAILFGVVATVITYLNSRRLKGEVFEIPFVYFSVGILFATISLVAVTFFQGSMVPLIHDVCFILGLAGMLVASMKITRYLQGMEKFMSKLKK